MRTKSISQEEQEKKEKFESWIYSMDYISIPIKDVVDNNERKFNDRLKARDRKIKRA